MQVQHGIAGVREQGFREPHVLRAARARSRCKASAKSPVPCQCGGLAPVRLSAASACLIDQAAQQRTGFLVAAQRLARGAHGHAAASAASRSAWARWAACRSPCRAAYCFSASSWLVESPARDLGPARKSATRPRARVVAARVAAAEAPRQVLAAAAAPRRPPREGRATGGSRSLAFPSPAATIHSRSALATAPAFSVPLYFLQLEPAPPRAGRSRPARGPSRTVRTRDLRLRRDRREHRARHLVCHRV